MTCTTVFPGLSEELFWGWCYADGTLQVDKKKGTILASPCDLLPRMLPGLGDDDVLEAMRAVLYGGRQHHHLTANDKYPFCGMKELLLVVTAVQRMGMVEKRWHADYVRSQIVTYLYRCDPIGPKGLPYVYPLSTRGPLVKNLFDLWEECESLPFRLLWNEMERWPTSIRGSTDSLINFVYKGNLIKALASLSDKSKEEIHSDLVYAGIIPCSATNADISKMSQSQVLMDIVIKQDSPRMLGRLPLTPIMLTYMALDLSTPASGDIGRCKTTLGAFKGCIDGAIMCSGAEEGLWAQFHVHNAVVHVCRFHQILKENPRLGPKSAHFKNFAPTTRPLALRTHETSHVSHKVPLGCN